VTEARWVIFPSGVSVLHSTLCFNNVRLSTKISCLNLSPKVLVHPWDPAQPEWPLACHTSEWPLVHHTSEWLLACHVSEWSLACHTSEWPVACHTSKWSVACHTSEWPLVRHTSEWPLVRYMSEWPLVCHTSEWLPVCLSPPTFETKCDVRHATLLSAWDQRSHRDAARPTDTQMETHKHTHMQIHVILTIKLIWPQFLAYFSRNISPVCADKSSKYDSDCTMVLKICRNHLLPLANIITVK